jgi:hypothetical protein
MRGPVRVVGRALGPAILATAVVAASATATIVPFKQVSGVRLGMTLRQAKAALGPDCPTLTRTTRRNRARYDCYFDTFRGRGGWLTLIFTRRGECGADIDFHARRKGATRRVVDLDSACSDAFADGVGIGSTFHAMYRHFAAGTVRCTHRAENNEDACYAQRRRHGEIRLTIFSNDNGDRDLRVHDVEIKRCESVSPSPPAGAHRFMPCTKTFLTTQARVPGEFTP